MKTYPTKGKHAKGVRWQTRAYPTDGFKIIRARTPMPNTYCVAVFRRGRARVMHAVVRLGQRRAQRHQLLAPAATGKSLGTEQFMDAAREWANSKGWGDQ